MSAEELRKAAETLLSTIEDMAARWDAEADYGDENGQCKAARATRLCAAELRDAFAERGCCTACKGEGYGFGGEPCWDCRGTGHPHEHVDLRSLLAQAAHHAKDAS
jgi:DnaJ-class molecular chaperone